MAGIDTALPESHGAPAISDVELLAVGQRPRKIPPGSVALITPGVKAFEPLFEISSGSDPGGTPSKIGAILVGISSSGRVTSGSASMGFGALRYVSSSPIAASS